MFLYASSFPGLITTLELNLPVGNTSTHANTLETVSTLEGHALSPSWLTLDSNNGILYCLDRGSATVTGSLLSIQREENGQLTQLDRLEITYGAVSSVIYGNAREGLAVAHYTSSGFSTFSIQDPSALKVVQHETFTLSQPGPVPSRQAAPHPHQAIVDPTGEYILVPDLGADLIRRFKIGGLDCTELEPVVVGPGSGPRHAAFLVTEERTYLYVTNELTNTITGYDVHYDDSINFSELFSTSTHGQGNSVPDGTTAAGIVLSPDNRFLIISSRGENSFTIPNFDVSNSSEMISDAIITFSVDQTTGKLSFLQSFPSGGRVPRHFSINKAGDLVAVGLQSDGCVVVIKRNIESGLLERFIGHKTVGGEVTAVIFSE